MTTTTTTEITIDGTDIDSLAEAVALGITTVKLLANWLGLDLVDDCLVLGDSPVFADDGNAEIEYDSETRPKDAATEYVEAGDYSDGGKSTCWIDVTTYRKGVSDSGEIVQVGEESHTITIEATEPDCEDDRSHDWQSPLGIVGGCNENPGVQGHGGGVVITECCMICGCRRQTDTWAQRSDTGEQGLTSVEYSEGEYAEDVTARAIKRAARKLEAVQYPASQYDWVGRLNTDDEAHADAEGIAYVGLSDDEMREYGLDLLADDDAVLATEGLSWLTDDEIAELAD